MVIDCHSLPMIRNPMLMRKIILATFGLGSRKQKLETGISLNKSERTKARPWMGVIQRIKPRFRGFLCEKPIFP
jgi:hypothetical protein